MNNNINTLLNSLSDLGKIRKADKKIEVSSSKSDNTMTVNRPIKYKYFPTSKQELQEIIAKKILEEGYECDLNDICIKGVGAYDLSGFFYYDISLGNKFWITQKKQNGIDIRKFNGHIENWDTSNVKSLYCMLCGCSNFDQDISGWNVSSVENMYGMFICCSSFNQDISGWNVSSVENMKFMFDGCLSFNQNISDWDVSNVKDMQYMFCECSSFNQNISDWDVSNVKDWDNIFDYCPIKEEYKPSKFRK